MAKSKSDDLIGAAGKVKITDDLVTMRGGRPVSKETIDYRKKILRFAKKGISNPDLAEKLEIPTAKSQALAKPLIAKGLLVVDRENGRVVYTTNL